LLIKIRVKSSTKILSKNTSRTQINCDSARGVNAKWMYIHIRKECQFNNALQTLWKLFIENGTPCNYRYGHSPSTFTHKPQRKTKKTWNDLIQTLTGNKVKKYKDDEQEGVEPISWPHVHDPTRTVTTSGNNARRREMQQNTSIHYIHSQQLSLQTTEQKHASNDHNQLITTYTNTTRQRPNIHAKYDNKIRQQNE